MTDQELEKQIAEYISRNLLESSQDLSPDTELMTSSLLDSMNLVSLTLFLEKLGGRKIPAADVRPENMNTIRQIVQYLRKTGGV